MPPQMKEVYSSHVAKVGYDRETRELHVVWDSGKHSVYSGVPEALANDVMVDWSVGTALSEKIKPYYKHRYA